MFGATPSTCKSTCDLLAADVWPCSSDGPCDCPPGTMLLSKKAQLRGRSLHLMAGVGLVQENATRVKVEVVEDEAPQTSEVCSP